MRPIFSVCPDNRDLRAALSAQQAGPYKVLQDSKGPEEKGGWDYIYADVARTAPSTSHVAHRPPRRAISRPARACRD